MLRNAAYEKCLLDQAAYWRDRSAQTRHQIEVLRSELHNAQINLRSFESTKTILEEIVANWNKEKTQASESIKKIANATSEN